ncbi:precorrin-3B C(17)-methyltransferase [uncultured Bacteroides sp.]|uniref:precorrin-3B C(17)-methyltransferase n=1 Tax=uncultured Bacteroides sp. TaxID=162156 RepID=UPI00267553E8|nr:precorrin-3B C(17)-methyltransferase [uncultured Bacteroides sp.]
MKESTIIVAGIGPGSPEDITPAVINALRKADVVIGYKYYFRFIAGWVTEGTECIDTGMKREKARAELAFEYAEQGKTVCVISSGDAGIYGMAPLIYEMKRERGSEVEVVVLSGISAFQKAASLLGAPVGHDFCIISLSDLMTSWEIIEKRITAAAVADFVTAVYNPKSEGRYWQLHRLKEIFLESRSPETPVGYVRQAGREEETVVVTNLEGFDPEDIDMFTVVLIGNSQTYRLGGKMITPRGYYRERESGEVGKGQEIMINSFRKIEAEMQDVNIDLDRKWALFHAIHTTADFEMERLVYTDKGVVGKLHEEIVAGNIKTIVTDVTMVASGIRKGALQRLGVEVKCYLSDERAAEQAKQRGTTRSQEAIRLAAEEHPDALFVFGNAPTALIELCGLIRKGKAHPAGVIAAPVGFVHVKESKYMIKTFTEVPKIIVRGRRGGSNLAATLVNAVLCFDDAREFRPGRDV